MTGIVPNLSASMETLTISSAHPHAHHHHQPPLILQEKSLRSCQELIEYSTSTTTATSPIATATATAISPTATAAVAAAAAAVTLLASNEVETETEFEAVTPESPNRNSDTCSKTASSPLTLEDLPTEILDQILDHLLGVRQSTWSSSGSAQSWTKALRHPRRKAVSNLALVSRLFRPMVQGRIYRHIKIKGTRDDLAECGEWFLMHPHLTPLVRHIEFWIPVWGNRTVSNPARRDLTPGSDFGGASRFYEPIHTDIHEPAHGSSGFARAVHNASLEEIFTCIKTLFPDAKILTIEGGHCKKPPMVQHFRDNADLFMAKSLEALPNIHTFIMRGAWNIMRDYSHWNNLSKALPNVREWHCAYAKPKAEAYYTMGRILRQMPKTLLHLNLSLEGFCSKENSQPWLTSTPPALHLCKLLGYVSLQLESLTFTGRVCHAFFAGLTAAAEEKRVTPRLKTLDLVVKNCCRDRPSLPKYPSDTDNTSPVAAINNNAGIMPLNHHHHHHHHHNHQPQTQHPHPHPAHAWLLTPILTSLDNTGTGLSNLPFITAFENLTLSAIKSLSSIPTLTTLRIRHIDLDSACPLLNPYWQLNTNNEVSGIWNEEMVELLGVVRPEAKYLDLGEQADEVGRDGRGGGRGVLVPSYGREGEVIGVVFPRVRPVGIRTVVYRVLADLGKTSTAAAAAVGVGVGGFG